MSSIYDKSSLVLIPSGTKTSKVYSQKPTNGDGDFDFTRSTAATRVNASGNIEKETMNLMPYSNNFSQWSPKNGTFAQGVSDPFGGNNAWSLTATNADPYLYLNPSVTGLVTLSVWAKGVGSSIGKDFLLISSGSSPNNSAHILTSEWVRYEGYFNCTSPVQFGFEIPNPAVVGDVVHIYGAQLEYGLVARDYIETTTTAVEGGITDNVPRLDYTDSSCPALLLEPQRTNLVVKSEYYGDNDWSKTRCDIVTNTSETLSPEGLYNASKMTSNAIQESYAQDNIALGSTSGTFSFFAKKGDLDYCHALVWDISANGSRQWFNLTTGAVGTTTNFGSGYTKVDASIEDYGNGWYRCSFSWSGGNTTSGVRINISSGDGVIGSPINSYGYFYGAQCEALASYATSYIPTYGTSVTRNGDSCLKTGVSNLIGQTEGTIAGEFTFKSAESVNRLFSVNGANWNTDGSIRFDIISLKPQATIRSNSNEPAKIIGTQDINVGDEVKFAVVYTSTELKLFVNGVQIGSTTTLVGSLPVINNIVINALGGGFVSDTQNNQLNPYKQALVFKTALTDQEAIDLTTI